MQITSDVLFILPSANIGTDNTTVVVQDVWCGACSGFVTDNSGVVSAGVLLDQVNNHIMAHAEQPVNGAVATVDAPVEAVSVDIPAPRMSPETEEFYAKYPRHGQRWTAEEDKLIMSRQYRRVESLVERVGRTASSISQRRLYLLNRIGAG